MSLTTRLATWKASMELVITTGGNIQAADHKALLADLSTILTEEEVIYTEVAALVVEGTDLVIRSDINNGLLASVPLASINSGAVPASVTTAFEFDYKSAYDTAAGNP